MRNRAKCRLCGDILESFHLLDWVTCKCDEISICGGQSKLDCSAKNWCNFMRIDDLGNEIIVTVKDKNQDPEYVESKEDLIKLLDSMIEAIKSLPEQAQSTPITHYDYLWILTLIRKIIIN